MNIRWYFKKPEFCDCMGISCFEYSDEWLEKFKKRLFQFSIYMLLSNKNIADKTQDGVKVEKIVQQ